MGISSEESEQTSWIFCYSGALSHKWNPSSEPPVSLVVPYSFVNRQLKLIFKESLSVKTEVCRNSQKKRTWRKQTY
jgi:hypothetical protein